MIAKDLSKSPQSLRIAYLTNISTNDTGAEGSVHVSQVAEKLMRRGHQLYTNLQSESDPFVKLTKRGFLKRGEEIGVFSIRIDDCLRSVRLGGKCPSGRIGRKEALKSAIGQTYTHIEIIVSDNCSTDNTGAVVKGFEDPRAVDCEGKKEQPSSCFTRYGTATNHCDKERLCLTRLL